MSNDDRTAGRNRFPALPSSGRDEIVYISGTRLLRGDLVRVRGERTGDDGRRIVTMEGCPLSDIATAVGFVNRACEVGETIYAIEDREAGR